MEPSREHGDGLTRAARHANSRGSQQGTRVRAGSDPGAHAAELTLRAGAEGEHLGLGHRLAVASESARQQDDVTVTRSHGLDRGGVRRGAGSGDRRHAVLPPPDYPVRTPARRRP